MSSIGLEITESDIKDYLNIHREDNDIIMNYQILMII